jgi:hypothetical protein
MGSHPPIARVAFGVEYTFVESGIALPCFLKVWWLGVSPIAALFAAHVIVGKNSLDLVSGPHVVGFSLMHIHPMLGIVGMLGSAGARVWLLPAILYTIARRKSMHAKDVAMIACAVLVVTALFIPDNFFAK